MEKLKDKILSFTGQDSEKNLLKKMGPDRLLIMILVGLLLLIIALPSGTLGGGGKEQEKNSNSSTDSEENQKEDVSEFSAYRREMEEQLEELLSQVEGAGRVKVMVTLASSSEKITLKDEQETQEKVTETDAQGGSRSSISVTGEEESVLVEDGEGSSLPYVTKTTTPQIEGVVVLSSGAEDAGLKNEIIEAVEVLFPVSAHKIKVMKME